MAALIDQGRRARARAAGAERQARILEVARDMLRRMPVGEVSLDTVCNRADVKAGLGSMYFGSRDELFLRIAREEIDAWLDHVGAMIDDAEAGALVVDALSAAIAADVASRELLVRVLAQAWVVLEGRIATGEVMGFARWQVERAHEVGGRLDALPPGRPRGTGERAILRLQQQMAAWVQGAAPRGPLEVALALPEMEAVRCDLEAEVRQFLGRELEGRADVANT
jgi:AcrR family transcriptional regulator